MNDIIVNALANNRRFQGMALKIDSFLSKNQQTIKNDLVKPGEKVMKEKLAQVKESKAGSFAQVFVKELRAEITAELNKAKSQNQIKK